MRLRGDVYQILLDCQVFCQLAQRELAANAADMRYAVFQIPHNRLLTKGGWDDFFFWTDDLADARKVVTRDPGEEVHRTFGQQRRSDRQTYQIVDLQTGEVIVDTSKDDD